MFTTLKRKGLRDAFFLPLLAVSLVPAVQAQDHGSAAEIGKKLADPACHYATGCPRRFQLPAL